MCSDFSGEQPSLNPPRDLRQAVLLVRNALLYDQETGVFTWLVATSNRVRVGNVAGCVSRDGYRYVGIGGRQYPEHRLAWLCVTGEWPRDWVDHVNGIKTDNRWSNLRGATRAQNRRNSRRRRSGKSGYKGVSWHRSARKWQARIAVNHEEIFLGHFSSPEAAHNAYCKAAIQYHGEFARFK
jgi:hypothetical protein